MLWTITPRLTISISCCLITDVWIIWDSFIRHLYDRAVFRQALNLELGERAVFWNRISSMRWEQQRLKRKRFNRLGRQVVKKAPKG